MERRGIHCSGTMSEHRTPGNQILSMMVCSLKECSNDAPSLQAAPASPGIPLAAQCSFSLMVWLTLRYGAAEFPPFSWKSLGSTDLCFPLHYVPKAKLSNGANLHLSADCSERLLRSLEEKDGGICCDSAKSGLVELNCFLCTERHQTETESLTPGFPMKIYPFFVYLQFPIKILIWRECNYIGSDSSNPFV